MCYLCIYLPHTSWLQLNRRALPPQHQQNLPKVNLSQILIALLLTFGYLLDSAFDPFYPRGR